MLALVVAKVLFAEVMFATEIALISATKYGLCGVTHPVATGPPSVVRVGNNRAKFSLSHHRAGMLGAARSAVPNKKAL